MSLRVQLSHRRRKRMERRIGEALTDAGRPFRRLAVVAHDSPDDTRVEIMPLGVFLARLQNATEDERRPGLQTWMRGCLRKARGYYDRGLIPEWLTFAEGGAELNQITPPDGTW